jgi:hypothetical protein
MFPELGLIEAQFKTAAEFFKIKPVSLINHFRTFIHQQ